MWVDITLGLIGTAFLVGLLGPLWWAFTRPPDRIQLATACLFFSTMGYFGVAAALARAGGPGQISAALGIYGLLLYLVMGVLAIGHARWAWRASIGAFGVHLLVGVAMPFLADGHGVSLTVLLGGAAVWLLVGGIGLWACLHPGSRRLVLEGPPQPSDPDA